MATEPTAKNPSKVSTAPIFTRSIIRPTPPRRDTRLPPSGPIHRPLPSSERPWTSGVPTMRDEKILRARLEQLRGQFLQWGTPDLMVFVTTKDELRGWIHALEWVLKTSKP